MNKKNKNEMKVFTSFMASFKDKNREGSFLEHNIHYIKGIIRIVLLFYTFNNFFLILIHLLSENPLYGGINTIFMSRILSLLFGIYILVQLKKIVDHEILERLVFSYLIFLAVTNGIIHLEFPDPDELTYAIEIMVILSIYLVFPINLKLQTIAAILFTLSNFTSLSLEIQTIKKFSHTLILMINCNIIAYIAARYYQKTARKLFMAFEIEKALKEKYEKTLLKLKDVSGLVPICKTCKSVQNDKGIWDRVEEFITGNSEILFTHSMCPECTKIMHDEIKAYKGE